MENALHQFTVLPDETGFRLDKFLANRLPEMSRNRLQALIESGHVTCNSTVTTDSSRKVKPLQEYGVTIPEPAPSHIMPQDIALDVVYEDAHLLVINKPAGLTVHPAPGHLDMTLVNALLAHCGDSLSGIGGVARPGIVHRIDKDTSGLLVVAKNDAAHAALSAQLADRSLKRTYNALVWGVPEKKSGTITGAIGRSPKNRKKMAVIKKGGKEAATHYKILTTFNAALSTRHSALFSLLECRLETGRTHQIRVHFTHIKHPLIGDPVYGQSTAQHLKSSIYKSLPEKTREALLNFNRQALHAMVLELIHPATKKPMRFSCPLPDDMKTLIDKLS